jgi:hypothetical protein
MLSADTLAFAALLSGASAAVQGFNYGAQGGSSGVKVEADYQFEFEAALSLSGTDGQFNSARLYTMCVSANFEPTCRDFARRANRRVPTRSKARPPIPSKPFPPP